MAGIGGLLLAAGLLARIVGAAGQPWPPVTPVAYLPLVLRADAPGTPTPTETATATPTSTPTPSATPTQCSPGIVSPATSGVAAAYASRWADGFNESGFELTVWLSDNCGDPVLNRSLSEIIITSSRGPSDTVTASAEFPPVNNTFFYDVVSAEVGASQYTATVDADGPGPLGEVSFGGLGAPASTTFVCVAGSAGVKADPATLPVVYDNPDDPAMTRRLVYLRLIRSANPGAINSISFGSLINVIWDAGSGQQNLEVLSHQWTGGNRSIVATTQRTLLIQLAYPVAGTGEYTLVTDWDDGAGGRVCRSPAVMLVP